MPSFSRSRETSEVDGSNNASAILTGHEEAVEEGFKEPDKTPTGKVFRKDAWQVEYGNMEAEPDVYWFDGRGPQFIASNGQEDEVEPS